MSATDGWAAAVDSGDPNPVERVGATVLDRLLGSANARMVYGEPVQHGDRTVIPVARISARFGFGGGGGRSTMGDGPASGSGGGGGGTVDAKPIGYIEITDNGSEFHEIQDTTQIALAGIKVGMLVVTLVLLRVLFVRRRRKDRAITAAIADARKRRLPGLRRNTRLAEAVEAVVEQAPNMRRRRIPGMR